MSKILSGSGSAQLEYVNCWDAGKVNAYLNGARIDSAPPQTQTSQKGHAICKKPDGTYFVESRKGMRCSKGKIINSEAECKAACGASTHMGPCTKLKHYDGSSLKWDRAQPNSWSDYVGPGCFEGHDNEVYFHSVGTAGSDPFSCEAVSGLCGNFDCSASNDGPPKLRSLKAMEVPAAEAVCVGAAPPARPAGILCTNDGAGDLHHGNARTV